MFRCIMCGEDIHPEMVGLLRGQSKQVQPDGRLCDWCSQVYCDEAGAGSRGTVPVALVPAH